MQQSDTISTAELQFFRADLARYGIRLTWCWSLSRDAHDTYTISAPGHIATGPLSLQEARARGRDAVHIYRLECEYSRIKRAYDAAGVVLEFAAHQ